MAKREGGGEGGYDMAKRGGREGGRDMTGPSKIIVVIVEPVFSPNISLSLEMVAVILLLFYFNLQNAPGKL